MTAYEDIISYLNNMKVANVEKFFPFYIASAGSHLLNRRNYKKHIITSHGLPMDLRTHMFFVTQPGFGKTFTMRMFADYAVGIFMHTELNPGWEDRMTEARFSGTVSKDRGGNVDTQRGAAWDFRNSILCVDEFHALAETMKTSHSGTFESALCTALESGWIRKGLGGGRIEYETQMTLWAGSQPAKYDLGQGIGRRFIFINFAPSQDDIVRLKNAMREGLNRGAKKNKLKKIKTQIDSVWEDIYNIEYIRVGESVEDYLDKLKIMPYECPLYKKLAMGYTVMSKEFGRTLTVEMDSKLKRMFKNEAIWRKEIKRGPELSQIIQVMKDLIKEHGEEWIPLSDVREKMVDFNVNFEKFENMVREARHVNILKQAQKESYNNIKENCLKFVGKDL